MKTIPTVAVASLMLLAPKSGGADEGSPPLPGYQLVWSDEFNGPALDTATWAYRKGPKMLSMQKEENVSVADGFLKIALKKEGASPLHYTAGGVISHKTFKYGYYEARFRCPKGAGWHTSFWTIAGKAQEIDICEQDSVNNRSYSAGVIDWSGTKQKGFGRVYYRDSTPDFAADFHVWGCEFTPTKVRFFLDGKLTHGADATKFPHGNQNVWLTCLGVLWGNPTKPKHIDDSALPAFAEFDWVRVYEKKLP